MRVEAKKHGQIFNYFINQGVQIMTKDMTMGRHRLLISSMREASETLKVAAKNVSPLVRMLWLR